MNRHIKTIGKIAGLYQTIKFMELYLKWLDKYERKEGEGSPVGLILCSELVVY
jgi:hypothetical protein